MTATAPGELLVTCGLETGNWSIATASRGVFGRSLSTSSAVCQVTPSGLSDAGDVRLRQTITISTHRSAPDESSTQTQVVLLQRTQDLKLIRHNAGRQVG